MLLIPNSMINPITLVSLVVPVYHNAPSLPDLLVVFQALAARNPNDEFEFIFVDDGSGDNSHEVLLNSPANRAAHACFQTLAQFWSIPRLWQGSRRHAGKRMAAIAAYLQDPPELIHDMLEKWRQGHKVILAARAGRDDPGITSMLADAFYALFRRFAIKTMPQRGFDFFLLDRQVVDHINAIQESNPYLIGLIFWLGFDPQCRLLRSSRTACSVRRLDVDAGQKDQVFHRFVVAFSYLPVRAESASWDLSSVASAASMPFLSFWRGFFRH